MSSTFFLLALKHNHRRRPFPRPALAAAAVLLVLLAPLAAQEPVKRLDVSCLTVPPPKIDGHIDDDVWKAIEPVSGFYQYDPVNGVPASEETFVWAAYDQDYLYFAFLMKDSQPDKIWAELTPRNEWDDNDSIELILDAYNDKRTSITFAVNPRGVQKNSVETIWKSGAVMRPDGWSAEMSIPFKSLRFSANKLDVWGVNFERYIYRLKETDFWTDVDRDLPRLQQSGELCGLTGLRPGYNLEFFPYAGIRTSKQEGETDTKAAAGLDVKWGIKPNLYLDVTASPDFSEVESDPFIPQLSPYENYLDEHRPFFPEGSRYFNLSGGGGYGGPDVSLFYSRRIRNPRFAAKVSGKTGGFGFGILGAINKVGVDEGEDPRDSHFGIIRVQKDILKNSQVGVYYAGVKDGEAVNQNVALDFSFNFSDFYYIQGMAARTFNDGAAGARNGVYSLEFEREPDAGLQLQASFQRVEDEVDISTGYIDQIDYQSFNLTAGHAWRYDEGLFKRLSFDIDGDLRQDTYGNATGQSVRAMFFSDFFNLIEVHGGFDLGRSKYQVRDEDGALVWTPDYIKTYGFDLDFDWERGGFLKEVSLEGGWDTRGVYADTDGFTTVVPGSQTSVEGQIVLRPWSNFEWSFEGDWIRQTVEGSGDVPYNALTYETALHYQITRSLFLNTRLLGETEENQYSFDFLIGYYFGAGNVVQLAFKKSERNDILGQIGGYSVTLKVSYLLRI
ncbi:MAG: carbohydrate binding family 9 domain-containing protein [Candidatus Aminicenantes bacterium]|nr:carbohydrate binding family 9 domain-containing protein [Candidatus Aminicenantes bacterium]